jgi:hypothetical protein
MRKLSRRGEALGLSSVPYAVVMLVVLAILLGLGASILLTTQQAQCTGTQGTGGAALTFSWNATSSQCNTINSTGATINANGGTYASNSSVYGQTGMNTISQWVPTIAIVLAASVVIGLVMAYLMGRRD